MQEVPPRFKASPLHKCMLRISYHLKCQDYKRLWLLGAEKK